MGNLSLPLQKANVIVIRVNKDYYDSKIDIELYCRSFGFGQSRPKSFDRYDLARAVFS